LRRSRRLTWRRLACHWLARRRLARLPVLALALGIVPSIFNCIDGILVLRGSSSRRHDQCRDSGYREHLAVRKDCFTHFYLLTLSNASSSVLFKPLATY
jgi:hypothetical protein